MKQRYTIYALFLLSLFVSISASAQIKGVITDSLTNEPLMYITVQYEGKGVGGISNANGEYQVETRKGWDELTFSAVGYITKKVKLKPGTRVLNVKLQSDDIMLSEVVVKPQKEKYSRKNNPAVEFMKKVIENKKALKLEENDYYQYQKYEKMKMSLNDVTPDKMEKGIYKKFSFFKDQVEVSPKTNKMILPISIKETASKTIFRKSPKSEKTIIEGMNSTGIEEFFNTGDMLGTILTDVFSDINIYDDDIRLLQRRFVSPIGRGAISFYKYYLMDTLMVDRQECVHLTFVPQNPQDFGFTGHLYVVKDSTYAVKKCTMNLPKKTGVNFVENLDIVQQFEQLPDGNWVLTDDDMTVELHFVKGIQGLEVQRTTKYSDYQFTEIEPRLFRLKGNVIKEANMLAKSDEYWAKVRQVPLTKKESTMDVFMNRIEQIPGFKYVIFGAKALIENFVETGSKKHPSKFDFGPINTMITSNYVNGTRFRLSGMTTGNLDPHWSLSGYGAYGTKDKKWFYSGQVAYSFNKREYVLWEFPKHYIAFKYTYDVMSPMDKYLATDKDNLFVGWKWTTVDQMSYMRDATLTYELETNTGFSIQAMARHRNDQPAGQLQYWKNNGETPGQWDEKNTLVHDITTTELGVTLRYAPGETFVNTKQRRVPVSLDAPTFTLSHTAMEHRSLPPAEPTDGKPLVHHAEQRVLQPHQQHGVPERPLRLPQPKLRHERKTLQPHPAHQEAEVARDVPHPWSVGHADGQEQPIQEQQSRLVPLPHARRCTHQPRHGQDSLCGSQCRYLQYLQAAPHRICTPTDLYGYTGSEEGRYTLHDINDFLRVTYYATISRTA